MYFAKVPNFDLICTLLHYIFKEILFENNGIA